MNETPLDTTTPSIKAIDELVIELASAQERVYTIKRQLNDARQQIRAALRGGKPKRKRSKAAKAAAKKAPGGRRRGLPKDKTPELESLRVTASDKKE